MYIGDIIKDYRTNHQQSIEDFAKASSLSVSEIETLESNYKSNNGTPVSVSIRQIKGIAQAMDVPMPALMTQIPSDQQIIVQVVAESDQPHAK